MDKDKKTTRRSLADSNSSTPPSAAPTKDGRTPRTKRKASPEKNSPRKRTRVSKSEPRNEEDVSVRRGKRKLREDGEGPLMNKKRRILHDELPSSSVDTGRESSNPLEGCRTSVDVRKRSGKRQATATAEGEGPRRKKKRVPKNEEEPKKGPKEETKELSVEARRDQFEAKYEQQKNRLGAGGYGFVFAGYRRADNLPVAIKHIPEENVVCRHMDQNGKQLSAEVAVMLELTAITSESAGASAPVSLLDWYDLDQELILVMDRPVNCQDLWEYIHINGGTLEEEEAKIIMKQLVDAAIHLQEKNIFHRDIKVENILIESSTDVPRVRLIDFGLSCFTDKDSLQHDFYGTVTHIPPEWYNRHIHRAGSTTVWQLGVVLFDTLHRSGPFETVLFLVNKLTISQNLSQDCQNFLELCLSRRPENRPTLQELRQHPWIR